MAQVDLTYHVLSVIDLLVVVPALEIWRCLALVSVLHGFCTHVWFVLLGLLVAAFHLGDELFRDSRLGGSASFVQVRRPYILASCSGLYGDVPLCDRLIQIL